MEMKMYSDVIKEGIVKSTEYLSDKFELLEKASFELKDSFPVDCILTACTDKNPLKDLNSLDRKEFLRNVFEIYFSYSKNLLIYFEIYSEKSITENTSQIVNYLSKCSDYTKYLTLIGYIYKKDSKEWKYGERSLTKEREVILQFITICCCVGYSYLLEPLKLLRLSIFERRRKSLKNEMDQKACEYCNFGFNQTDFRCSVCDQGIEKMDFFKHWEINYITTMKDVYVSNGEDEKVTRPILNQIQGYENFEVSNSTWQCQSCTYFNENSTNFCSACLESKEGFNSQKSKSSSLEALIVLDVNPENKENMVSSCTKDQRNYRESPMSLRNTWKCATCSLNNSIQDLICNACLNNKGESVPKYNPNSNVCETKILNYPDPSIHWQCNKCSLVNKNESLTCSACLNKKSEMNLNEKQQLKKIKSRNYNSTFMDKNEKKSPSLNVGNTDHKIVANGQSSNQKVILFEDLEKSKSRNFDVISEDGYQLIELKDWNDSDQNSIEDLSCCFNRLCIIL